jgi:cell division protein FtsW
VAMTQTRRSTATATATATHRPTRGGRAGVDRSGGELRVAGRTLPSSTLLLVVVGLLCVIGLVMVGSASSVISIATYGTPWAILIREVMWMAIGLVVLGLAVRVDYRRLRRWSPVLLVVTFGLLVVVLVPGLGVHAEGSSRWIGFGQFRLQPSELMKLALAFFAADFITRRLDEDAQDRRIIGPLLLVTGSACVLILAQPDMGTAMVLVCMVLALLFVSGVRLGPVMKVMAALAALALIVAVASPYRRTRLLSFLDPSAHGSSSGYQVVQSLIGLGSGHLIGAGLGGGQQQWGYLPNAHTDFIFSVIGEQLGIVGALSVLLLLGAFLWLGIRAATRAPDRFGGLLALGLVAWVAAETLINIGAVVGVLPVTGIPLPFISFGGSSLVITMAAAGVLVSIARQGEAWASGLGPRAGSASRARSVPSSRSPFRGAALGQAGSGGKGTRRRRPAAAGRGR